MAKETLESLLAKGQKAIAQGRHDLARQCYHHALVARPDNPEVHYGMATVCFLTGDLVGASEHFREVTRLDPLRAGGHINLGAVLNRLNRYEDAIASLRRGIQLDMNRGEGYYNLGLVYRQMGQFDLAIQAYREAVRVNPRMADAHVNIANIFMEKTQYAMAIAHYKQALEIRPGWEKAMQGMDAAIEAQSPQAKEEPVGGPGSGRIAKEQPALDPNRTIDPNVHGELLRTLHRTTVESEETARKVYDLLSNQMEPSIKDLSACLLYPDTPLSQLTERMQRFDHAYDILKEMQQNLRTAVQRVRLVGEQLLKS
ncbi:MAG: tetratricopeptide repeat protein [Gemmataceae bacterium]